MIDNFWDCAPHQESLDRLRPVIAITAIFLLAGNADAVTIFNSSFEELTPGAYVDGPEHFMEATAPEGWTSASGTVDWYFGPGVDLWDTNWGNYFVHGASGKLVLGPVGGSLTDALADSGPDREAVSQTLAGLTPGEMYELHFNHANGYFHPPSQPPSLPGGWEVFINDTSILQAASANDASTSTFPFTTDWSSSSVIFEATSTSLVLTFLSYSEVIPMGNGASFQWLDNVTIVQSVPEPSSFASLATFLFLGFRRRRN